MARIHRVTEIRSDSTMTKRDDTAATMLEIAKNNSNRWVASAEYAQLQRRYNELVSKHREAKETVGHLMKELCLSRCSQGKNKLIKTNSNSEQDSILVKRMNDIIKSDIWPRFKMLNRDWYVYQTHDKSTCQRILSKMNLENLCDDIVLYWVTKLVPHANACFVNQRSKFDNAVRMAFLGKEYF